MATVVDELVLQLGLDTTKLTQGQREAMDQLRRMQFDLERAGKSAETESVKIGQLFTTIKGGAVGILAAFGGGEVAAFVDRVAHMDNATGRMAKTIGVSVETLDKWRAMIRLIGGDTSSAVSAFSGLQTAIEQFQHGGGGLSSAAMFMFNQIGGTRGKTPDQIMRDLSALAERQISSGRETVPGMSFMLQQIPGVNKDMVDLILKGPKWMAENAAEIDKVATATRKSAEASAEYVRQLGLLDQVMERLGRRLIPVLTAITGFLNFVIPNDENSKSRMNSILGWLNGLRSGDGKTHWYSMPDSSVPVKPGAGTSSPETRRIMDAIQGVPGIKQVTSLNDVYHQFLGGGHPAGRALDLTVTDPAQAEAVAQAIRAKLAAAGIAATVLNEYARPSRHATAPHIHVGAAPSMTRGGVGAGAAASRSVTHRGGDVSTSTTNVDKVIVNTQVSDADGFARNVIPAIQRFAKVTPGNYGQV